MTLIVGVRCSNGVVVGADSAATFVASDGHHTIRSEHIKKIQILNGKAIMASAGSVAMAQRIQPVLTGIWKGDYKGPNGQQFPPVANMAAHEAADHIRRILHDRVYQIEVNAAGMAERAGWRATAMETSATIMAAIPTKDYAALFTFNPVGLPEEVSDRLFCSNIGSGQGIADPFMGLMRRALWDDKMPTVQQAGLVVSWCLQHAIALHPGGVGGHVQVAVLEKRGAAWEARELGEGDLLEHRQNIKVGEGLLKDWHAGKLPDQRQDTPAIPVPAESRR